MMSATSASLRFPSASRATTPWRGRSGELYDLEPENLDRLSFRDGVLYLLAKGSLVLWVGTAHDLVVDHSSRNRFRLAQDCADRVFSVVGRGGDVERLTAIWDLEGAEPAASPAAA